MKEIMVTILIFAGLNVNAQNVGIKDLLKIRTLTETELQHYKVFGDIEPTQRTISTRDTLYGSFKQEYRFFLGGNNIGVNYANGAVNYNLYVGTKVDYNIYTREARNYFMKSLRGAGFVKAKTFVFHAKLITFYSMDGCVVVETRTGKHYNMEIYCTAFICNN